MDLEIKGTVKAIYEKETGTSANGEWSKQVLTIDTLDEYSKMVSIIGFGKVDFATIQVGMIVNFHINLESREYNDRFYTDVKCYQFEILE